MKRLSVVWLLFLILNVLNTSIGYSKPISIDADFQSELIGNSLKFLVDDSQKMSLQEVLQLDDSFAPHHGPVPLFSFSRSAYWFRIDLENVQDIDTVLFLQSACAWTDSLQLYSPNVDGSWKMEEIGDMFSFNSRRVPSILPSFRVDLGARSSVSLYLRAQTEDAFILPLFLKTERKFYIDERYKEYFFGVFFGLVGVMCLYNLSVFIFSRDRAYIIYTINTFAWFFLLFCLDGYAYAWLWPDNSWWVSRSYVIGVTMSTIWGTLFAKEFLKTKIILPKFNRFINIWLISQIILTICTFILPYHYMMLTAAISGSMFIFIISMTSILSLKKGFHLARYYLASWVFPSAGTLVYMAIIFGLIPANGLNIYILHAGIAMEIIMLSVAMGDRMRQISRDKRDLQVSIETARIVQESFLLQDFRSAFIGMEYWYEPSETLGGDWFACIESHDNKRLYICIGDVTGHGIATSLITGAAAGSFRTAAYSMATNSDLLDAAEKLIKQLNSTVKEMGARQNALMTLALVVVDLQSFEAVYLNAGHVNIFVKSKSDVHSHLKRGSLLGLNENPVFGTKRFQIAKDDLLIMYSDGVIENSIRHKEHLSQSRLKTIIDSSQNEKHLIDSVRTQFSKAKESHSPQDDSTLIVISFNHGIFHKDEIEKIAS
ncbi:MAG: 7TM diverse intracellular signaling domain-containing protein [Oligoflexus sp.]